MKYISIFALALLATLSAQAQRVSQTVAQSKAAQFFQSQRTGAHHGAPSMVSPELAYTAETKGEADFYVFNRSASSEGFVIINADESGTPILGYSMSSTFVADSLPDNMRWWISQYQKTKAYAAPKPGRVSIPNLIKTTWDQGDPFNSQIPTLGPGHEKFVTGCTATALAQVMKFWEYPTKGVSSNSYSIRYNSTYNITFSASFSNTTYDWANMLDDYSDGYTTAQAKAVATLMYHAGVAETSTYGQSSTGGTSAATVAIGPALLKHFNYDKGMHFDRRDDYADAVWEEMIYSELSKGRPIVYSGSNPSNPSSGHCFICHGYNALNGLYAINWGWGGYADGYFALTGTDALLPNYSGTGGGNKDEAYSASQSVYTHIQPNKGNDYEYRFCAKELTVTPSTGVQSASYTINRGSTLGGGEMKDGAFKLNIPLFRCVSLQSTTYDFGAAYRNVATGQVYFSDRFSYTDQVDLGDSYSNRSYNIYSSDIPYNGTYEVLLAIKPEGGNWIPVDYTGDPTKLPRITIKGGTNAERAELSISLPHDQLQVSKTMQIQYHDNYKGTFTFTSSSPNVATVSNTGLITGVGVGQTTITVKAAGDSNFLPTTKSFTLNVTKHVTYPVELACTATELYVGETARYTVSTPIYGGQVSYNVLPEGIVSVDANGNIKALSAGSATITATAHDHGDYHSTTQSVTIQVLEARPAQVAGLCFYDNPYVGTGNIFLPNDCNIRMLLINTGATDATCYVAFKADDGGYNASIVCEKGGEVERHRLDLSSIISAFTPGKFYTIEFYLDQERTKPMNVPSIRFYYAKSNQPTVGELIQVIKAAKEQGGIKKALIRALADKVLKR